MISKKRTCRAFRHRAGDVVRALKMTAALLVAIVITGLPLTTNAANIPRENLERMFNQMQRQSHWDLSKPLLWGYFFVNPTREPLDRAAPLLSAMGYQVVKIYLADKKSASAPDQWWLHIERDRCCGSPMGQRADLASTV